MFDISEFSTRTEKAFSELMSKKGISCSKISEDKINKVPDFLCESDNYKVVFEFKDINESGTTEWLSPNMLVRKNTTESTINRFIEQASNKFMNNTYTNFDSGLVVTNLRSFVNFESSIMPQIIDIINKKLSKFQEIGNLIICGYNNPGNLIVALHIFENKNSKRIIPKGFFNKFNHKYYN